MIYVAVYESRQKKLKFALFLRVFLLTDVKILFKESFDLSFVLRNLLFNLGHTVTPEVTLINKFLNYQFLGYGLQVTNQSVITV